MPPKGWASGPLYRFASLAFAGVLALGREPEQSKEKKGQGRRVTRALHVVIGAVNYMYYARSCPPLELIRRQPNQRQSEAIQRLRLFVKACDHGQLIEWLPVVERICS